MAADPADAETLVGSNLSGRLSVLRLHFALPALDFQLLRQSHADADAANPTGCGRCRHAAGAIGRVDAIQNTNAQLLAARIGETANEFALRPVEGIFVPGLHGDALQ